MICLVDLAACLCGDHEDQHI